MSSLFSRYPHLAACPLALISWVDPCGRDVWQTAGWFGVVPDGPARLSFSVRGEACDFTDLRDRGEFAFNIPPDALLDRLRREACLQSGPGRSEAIRLSFVPGAVIKGPCLDNCPVVFECRMREIRPEFERMRIVGEIVAVRVDGVLHRDDPFPAIRRLNSPEQTEGTQFAGML